jgi:hypothetical protein
MGIELGVEISLTSLKFGGRGLNGFVSQKR